MIILCVQLEGDEAGGGGATHRSITFFFFIFLFSLFFLFLRFGLLFEKGKEELVSFRVYHRINSSGVQYRVLSVLLLLLLLLLPLPPTMSMMMMTIDELA